MAAASYNFRTKNLDLGVELAGGNFQRQAKSGHPLRRALSDHPIPILL